MTEQRRGSARTRGYDADWEVLRAAQLLEQPYCVLCELDGNPWKVATDVDHLVSIRRAPHRRLDPTNLRSLCHAHHSQHTVRTDGGFGR
jgi:5-methylcytosine-specific restriction protein A